MKYLKRNSRANVRFLPVKPAFIAGFLVLVCFALVSGEVALAENNTPASGTGKAAAQQGGSTTVGTVTSGGSATNKEAKSCQLQPGAKPTGLVGNVNVRYDGDPATGLGYISNNGPCVWVVYLASYTMAHLDTVEGEGLYDSASVTLYPGQRLTMQVKVPTQCRMQLDLIADKVVDLSNANYPVYHYNGSFIAGMYGGGTKLCPAVGGGLLNGGTPTPTVAAPTPTPTPTATVAPTSTPAPTATIAPTSTPVPPTATAIPATTAVPATTRSTVAPVASTTASAAAPATPQPSVNPVTSAPVSAEGTPTTTAPAAVLGVEVTRPPAGSEPSAVDAASTNGPAVQAPSALASAGEGASAIQTQTSQTVFGWWIVLIFAGLAGSAYAGLRLVAQRSGRR